MDKDKDKDVMNRRKAIRFIALAWVVILVFGLVYSLCVSILRNGKIETTVKCAPYVANVYVDDVKVANNSTNYIEKGEHTVMCFLNGFSVEIEEMNIDENKNDITMELLAITSGGKKVYEDKVSDYEDVEGYSGNVDSDKIELTEAEQRLNGFLPYNINNFGIGTVTEDEKTTITITVWEPKSTQMAINKLVSLAKEAEVSIAEYDFRINNFTNQLAEIHENSTTDLETYVIRGYNWLEVELRGTGGIEEYEYALISVRQSTGDNVIYRALFKRRGDGTVKLVSSPYPILTAQNTPDVSIETLDYVNNLAQTMTGNT